MIQFAHSIICSTDLERSKTFYCQTLGMKISVDYGVCFTLEGDSLMIHDAKVFSTNIFKKQKLAYERKQGKGNLNIYFETDELEQVYQRVKDNGFKIIHKIQMQSWNQKVFRAYDPDGHIVEVGEPLWMKALK